MTSHTVYIIGIYLIYAVGFGSKATRTSGMLGTYQKETHEDFAQPNQSKTSSERDPRKRTT